MLVLAHKDAVKKFLTLTILMSCIANLSFCALVDTDENLLESHELNISVQSAMEKEQPTSSGDSDNCHDSKSPLHNCHFGHCQSWVSPSAMPFLVSVEADKYVIFSDELPKDFYPPSPYQPPRVS